MLLGYLLIAIFVGLAASIVALFQGTSFLTAFGIYTLVGAATLFLVPLTQMLVGSIFGRNTGQMAGTRGSAQSNVAHVEPARGWVSARHETPMRILAVDDDPFILELVPMITKKAGFPDITLAATGKEALDLLKTSQTTFDCFLLDVDMPGMNGIELCQRIRAVRQYRQTPIVMLSAKRDIQNMGDAYRAGATDYATKPFDIGALEMRLGLVKESAKAQLGARDIKSDGPQCRQETWLLNRSFALSETQLPLGKHSLVDLSALLSYLTQIPHKDAADVRLFAIRFDGVDAVQTQLSHEDFSSFIEDFATAAVACFDAKRTLMAYTNDATLLVATHSGSVPSTLKIERAIERCSDWIWSEDQTREDMARHVSVGGPVELPASKATRAEVSIDRAIAFLEDRTLEKRGVQIAGLMKR